MCSCKVAIQQCKLQRGHTKVRVASNHDLSAHPPKAILDMHGLVRGLWRFQLWGGSQNVFDLGFKTTLDVAKRLLLQCPLICCIYLQRLDQFAKVVVASGCLGHCTPLPHFNVHWRCLCFCLLPRNWPNLACGVGAIVKIKRQT